MSGENDFPAEPSSPPKPKRRTSSSFGPLQHLLRYSAQKPAEAVTYVGALVAGLHTVFYGLGLVALTSREQLLGLDTSLNYPIQKPLLTSLHVLWALPWSMLGATISFHSWASAIMIYSVFGPVLLRSLTLRYKNKLLFRFTHASFAIFAFACISILSTAARPTLAEGQPAPYFSSTVDPVLGGVAQAEVISWLTNDHPEHQERRQTLFGVVGWILVFFAIMLQHLHWLGRDSERGEHGLRIFKMIYFFLALTALPLLPKTYVLAYWGIEYPRVQSGGAPECCTYEVSAGGSPVTTLQVGEKCSVGFRSWTPEKAQELLIGVKEVIDVSCN